MKIKFLFALFTSCALGLSAQGYLDGIEYYRANQAANARTIFERTLNDADTDKAVAYYYLGQLAVQYKELDKAKTYFDNGIAANPEYGYNYIGLATLDLMNGDKKAAENNIKLAKKYGKKDAQLLVDIARMYYDVDGVVYKKEIQKAMKDAAKIDDQEPAYHIFIGDTLKQVAKTNAEIGEAANAYEMAIYYNPNSAVAYVKYSALYEKTNPEFSVKKMREYISINPNSILARRELANRLYDLGKWTQAVEAFEPVVKDPGHFVEDEMRYATLLMSGEKYEESYQTAKAVLGRTDNPNQAYRIMMHSKIALEEYPEAAKWAKELLKSKGSAKITDVDHTTYGAILSNMALTDTANAVALNQESINQYKEALAVNDSCFDAYKSMASVYRNMGDYPSATESFDKFIASGAAKAGDYHTYAGILLNYANQVSKTDAEAANPIYDKAIQIATEAVSRSNSPYAQERKAIILFSKNSGLNADVAQAFEKVVELLDANPQNVTEDPDTYKTALGQIGDYYSKAGDNEKALAAYNRYLQFDPNNEKVKERVSILSAQ